MKEFRETISSDVEIELSEGEPDLVSKNLNKMDGEMVGVLLRESMGGNAGVFTLNNEVCSCAGVNGFLDASTGEMVAFGNPQDLNLDIMKDKAFFIIKIAIPKERNFQIVEFIAREGFEGLSESAERVIKMSINKWNQSRFT